MVSFRNILFIMAGLIIAIGLLGWLGLQIQPKPFPAYPEHTQPLKTVPLPAGLPKPAERFYKVVYGEEIPVIETVGIQGRAVLKPFMNIAIPARFIFVHNVGKDYRHFFEATIFGIPFLKVNEGYIDGASFFESPMANYANDPKSNQAANLTVWAEAIWFPALWVTDPRARWVPVDEYTALLYVPFEEDGENFLVRFDPQTGLIDVVETMRYRDTGELQPKIPGFFAMSSNSRRQRATPVGFPPRALLQNRVESIQSISPSPPLSIPLVSMPHSSPPLLLKLGGSLITDKNRPQTARRDTLARLANEIAEARRQAPGLRLVLGHGSGSFGHVPARRWGTREGVHTPQEWQGFIEVWRAAQALHRLVLDALAAADLPAIAFPPSATATARNGQVASWNLDPLRRALQAGLVPVVYGDVAFDTARGGTILSTEDLFAHLARQLQPRRLLYAGLEPGVWADFPARTRLLAELTPQHLPALEGALGGSAAPDVTGGMASKVRLALALAAEIPGLEALVFSGETPGNLRRALLGERVGTLLAS